MLYPKVCAAILCVLFAPGRAGASSSVGTGARTQRRAVWRCHTARLAPVAPLRTADGYR